MSTTESSEHPAAVLKEFRKNRKLVFIMLGSVVVYGIMTTILMAWSTQTNVPARGVVTGVDIVAVDRWFFEPNVTYRYDVGEVTYEGGQFHIGGVSRYTRARATLAANAYVAGDSVTVHVNPDDPTDATLRNTLNPFVPLQVAIGMLGMAIMYWLGMVWRPKQAGMIASYADWY